MTDFQTTGDILLNYPLNNSPNVKNVNNYNSNNVKEINVNVGDEDREEKIKFIAQDLATKLDDSRSLNYYLKIAREHKLEFLYECWAITLEAKRDGIIRETPAKYFVGILKRRSGKK